MAKSINARFVVENYMSKLLSIILLSLCLFIPNANAASTYYDANGNKVSAETYVKAKKQWDKKTIPIIKAREEAYRKSITRVIRVAPKKACVKNVCSIDAVNRAKLKVAPPGAGFSYWRNVYASRKGEYGDYKGLGQSFKTPGRRYVRKNTWLTDHGYSISMVPGGTRYGVKRYNMIINLPCMYIDTSRSPCKSGRRSTVKRYPRYNTRMNDRLMRQQMKYNVYQKQSVWPWEQK